MTRVASWRTDSCKCGRAKDYRAKTCSLCVDRSHYRYRRGEDNGNWKGGVFVHGQTGYVMRYAPDHPWPRKGGHVREHVRLMELHLGRRIVKGEHVHHINHDKLDNRFENLRLMSASEHSSYHRMNEEPRQGGGRSISSWIQNQKENFRRLWSDV